MPVARASSAFHCPSRWRLLLLLLLLLLRLMMTKKRGGIGISDAALSRGENAMKAEDNDGRAGGGADGKEKATT